MPLSFRRILGQFLLSSGLARLPVRVRSGIAEGARWSLYPWSAYWRGTHEPAVQRRLAGLWDWTGRQVWDLGSHYGLFAVGLGRRVGPGGGVAAFEPNPVALGRLTLHVRRNRLDWVKIFPFAVSDQISEQRFLSYGGFESTTSHLLYETETWNESIPTILVKTVRLDDLCADGSLKHPDFIKLDVEGHGHHALAGARRALEASRPVILAGLHTLVEAEGILSILSPMGYQYAPIDRGPTSSLGDLVGRDVLFVPPERAVNPAPNGQG